MKFDRALTVAVKILLASFFLYLLSVILLIPFVDYLIATIEIHILIGAMFGFIFALFGLAATVYLILREMEKISKETKGYVDLKRYDNQIGVLRTIIDEISKTLPKKTLARIEDIKAKCPKCGKKVPKGFKSCPNCGYGM